MIKLIRATALDCDRILSMQKEAFSELLEKYKDYDTSPATESRERVESKLCDPDSYFYYVYLGGDAIGAVRIVDKKDGSRKRVSPIFVMKEHRGKGIAKEVFRIIEELHGERNWKLDTILEEKGNCHLYESLGYKRTGRIEKINEKMNIVYYEKD